MPLGRANPTFEAAVRVRGPLSAGWMFLFAALPIILRLALLQKAPVPIPGTADDTSYLLLADTLSHFRLANPPHQFARFFETNFVLQHPTYSSIFPLGQGIALAAGKMIFGQPWAGVLLTEGLLCALCYWMLRGWVSQGWALAGGFIAVMQFGPLSYWMNSYWGGAVSGIAGCLIFGALPRRNGWLLGLGFGLQLLTRPYECALLLVGVGGWWALARAKVEARMLGAAGLAILPAVVLTLFHNHAVTESWTTLPYQMSRYQYGTPTTFTFQPNSVPHRDLNQEEQDNYDAQTAVHARESRLSFGKRLMRRASNLRFFFLPPLSIAVLGFALFVRDRRTLALLVPVCVLVVGTSFYPYFYPHYIAGIACVFVLMSAAGLEHLSHWSTPFAMVVLALAGGLFAVKFCVQLFATEQTVSSMFPYDGPDFVNRGDPEGRLPVLQQLTESPGKQLVFVRFGPNHELREWINNAAKIDESPVVWALDLGRAEDDKLRQYYSDRTPWLLEPDDKPPRLQPYPIKPQIHFEPVQ
jgi:hypothetical protein